LTEVTLKKTLLDGDDRFDISVISFRDEVILNQNEFFCLLSLLEQLFQ